MQDRFRAAERWTRAALIALAISGCTLGPNFKRPEAPNVTGYSAQSLPGATVETQVAGGGAQHFTVGKKIEQQWWTLFHSEPLNQLIQAALRDSPNVAAAQASLRQARETLAAGRGTLWPSVTAQAGATREREQAALLGLTTGGDFEFNLFNAGVDVSYPFDLFGGIRRQLESLQAQVDDQALQVEATYLSLTSYVVTAAIQAASLRAQLSATRDIEALEMRQVDVVQRRFSLGAVPKSDVLSQKTQLAQTHATVPSLERQLALAEDQLAIYAGRFPAEGGVPTFELDALELPTDLPVSVPSELVHQRPDILAAEALLHSASAQIGVATANQYPSLTLTGALTLDAFKLKDLVEKSAFGWSLGANLTAPIFNGGALAAKKRAAIAAYDQAAASYRQTVLQAFGNVADALRALDADARALQAQVDAQDQARAELDLAQKQFGAGALSQLQLLTAQQQFQQTRIAVIQLQASRYADTAALFAALGGGWWSRDTPAGGPAAANP